MKRITILIIFTLLFSSAAMAKRKKGRPTNWSMGPHLVFSFPQKDYKTAYSGLGEGLGMKTLYKIPSVPIVVPRLDFVFLSYGDKMHMIDYYSTITTKNEAYQLSLGPQFTFREGKKIRPYIAVMGGFYHFRQVVTISDAQLSYYYGIPPQQATTDKLSKWGYSANVGLTLDLHLGALIDINIKYKNIYEGAKIPMGEEGFVFKDATDIVFCLGAIFEIRKNR